MNMGAAWKKHQETHAVIIILLINTLVYSRVTQPEACSTHLTTSAGKTVEMNTADDNERSRRWYTTNVYYYYYSP